MSAVFVGYKTVVAPDFSNYVVEPKAPKNYKDPEKINAYIEEAKAEIRNTCASKPFTGIFQEAAICIYDDSCEAGNIPEFYCGKVYKGAEEFPEFLKELEDSVWQGVQAFMFQSYNFMRMVCLQAIRSKIKSRLVNHWLLNHPKARGLIVDLPKLFLPSHEEVTRIGYINMFKYFGVPLTVADLDNTQIQASKLYELYCAADKFDGLVVSEVNNGQ